MMNITEISKTIADMGKYKPNSINIFINVITKINGDLFGGVGGDKIKFNDFMDYERVYDYLLRQKLNNQKTFAHTLKVIMDTVSNDPKLKMIYTRIYNTVAKKVDSDRIYQKPSKQEKKSYMPWGDIIKKRDAFKNEYIKSKDPKDFYDYYILALFTYIPPLRPQELCDCVILDSGPGKKEKGNFYSMNNRELHIKQYKTEKSLGERTIKIPMILHNAIKHLFAKYNCAFLLPVQNFTKKNTNAGVCMYFKRFLGPSPSLLRKIFISYIMDNNVSAENKKKIARIMGHSPAVQVLIYSKFSKNIHGKK
jgi:hypothetical protein